jgi:hypothetical protein
MAEEESLHDTLSAAFDKTVAETPEPPTPAVPDSPAPTTDSLPDSTAVQPDKTAGAPEAEPGKRQRDASGRFTPKEVELVSSIPKFGEAAPGKPEDQVPTSWSKEAKPLWAKVPPEVRTIIHQREAELQQGFNAVAQKANVASAVLNEFVPYAEVLQKEGATPIMAMRTLLQTAHALRTGDPEYRKAIIYSLAQQYDVDLREPINPDLARAQAQAAQLRTEKMYGATFSEQQMVSELTNEMNAFANDPAHEFFPHVRAAMGQLIGQGIAQNLQQAYEMSIGIIPEVRAEIIRREAASQLAVNQRNRAANMSVTGVPNGLGMAPVANGEESLHDTIVRAFEGNVGRL